MDYILGVTLDVKRSQMYTFESDMKIRLAVGPVYSELKTKCRIHNTPAPCLFGEETPASFYMIQKFNSQRGRKRDIPPFACPL